jgi:NAD(P)-dependent dehydrogenase (short-subunit alcohol dehydrogenase family)
VARHGATRDDADRRAEHRIAEPFDAGDETHRTALTEVFYQSEAWQQDMLARIPMKRFGELDDLVGASVFLCSQAAAYVTGVCLPVDGGTLASL